MCGRYASFRQAQDLADSFARAGFTQGVLFQPEALALPASWNIAPTTSVAMIVDRPVTAAQAGSLVTASGTPSGLEGSDKPVRQVEWARWGLVPSWAKDPSIGVKMINARAETVADKPSFKRALAARRAIVPADGYYEWQAGTPKVPYYISAADGRPFAFAALYEFWQAPSDPAVPAAPSPWLVTTTIITTAARGDLGAIHDRRPVFLTPDVFDLWLDPSLGAAEVADILTADPIATKHVAVSARVGSVAHNDPGLIEPQPGPELLL